MGWGSSSAAVQAATLTCSALAADTGCCQAGGQGQALPCKGIRSARQAVVQGDQEEPREDRVVLSTIHRAKGLEWDAVFVVRCMQGHLPMPFWPPDWRWPLPHPPIDSPFLPAQHSVGRHTFGLQPAPWRRAQVECVGVAHGTHNNAHYACIAPWTCRSGACQLSHPGELQAAVVWRLAPDARL